MMARWIVNLPHCQSTRLSGSPDILQDIVQERTRSARFGLFCHANRSQGICPVLPDCGDEHHQTLLLQLDTSAYWCRASVHAEQYGIALCDSVQERFASGILERSKAVYRVSGDQYHSMRSSRRRIETQDRPSAAQATPLQVVP